MKLKAVLYQIPTRAEDHAAMIIEQAESAKDASTPAMMREYLMKVGKLLAPDSFHLAIEGTIYFINFFFHEIMRFSVTAFP